MEISLVVFGIIIGCIAMWFIAKYKFQSEKGISQDQLKEGYVSKELYEKLENDCKNYQENIKEKDDLVLDLNRKASSEKQINDNLLEKLDNQKQELDSLQKKLVVEFENIANRVLKNTNEEFVKGSRDRLGTILDPLKNKIDEFKGNMDSKFTDEMKERVTLKVEIKNLMEFNKQVSADANKLADAIKGEVKTQGNWGELKLEMILEKIGLLKGIHYRAQEVFTDEDGQKKQPDFIINLPENKHLIIDSKVSLVAYEKYFQSENQTEKKGYLNDHLLSIKNHIKDLKRKNYQKLYQINPPDYVLMFIPIESAYILASNESFEIFESAWDENIVVVTSSTLLATLRTVSFIWKQENQKRNVLEIARQSGALYDKFVDFIDDLKKVGDKIESVRESHDGAMKKLVASKRKSETIVGRIETIRKLGANTSKILSQEIIDRNEIEEVKTKNTKI